MDLTIKNQKENPLLSRKEIVAKINFEGNTPNRKDVQVELAKKAKIDEKLLIIKKIDTLFGETSANITAYAYENEEVMKRNERKNLVEKHKGHEPKVEEEAQ
ncbi:30S ribosomal protein S24e [Candidatus Woesearchaeota archaeon]|nr:30S ribosomal protein S24e [Candidatus Woesearchaeota archaeon]